MSAPLPTFGTAKKFVAKQRVHVEQFQDSPDHVYELGESDKLKHFQAIRQKRKQ
ncbi:hypothetical protein C2G38_2218371 [Gigaspora rosea]|uniref:Uncharacterized protein n=1 Tax=Gigaspora rosea TaxID=44941 RepID=A0A397U6R2_9GLOM|nr:hypothetical protein C2G38_2218371 [Gigaspora rosea]